MWKVPKYSKKCHDIPPPIHQGAIPNEILEAVVFKFRESSLGLLKKFKLPQVKDTFFQKPEMTKKIHGWQKAKARKTPMTMDVDAKFKYTMYELGQENFSQILLLLFRKHAK